MLTRPFVLDKDLVDRIRLAASATNRLDKAAQGRQIPNQFLLPRAITLRAPIC